MTLISPAAAPRGLRGPRRRAVRRPLPRLRAGLAALVTAAALVFAAVPAAVPAAAVVPAASEASSDALQIAVAAGGNGVVTAEPLTVTVTVTNSADSAATAADVVVAVSRTALTTDAAVKSWLADPSSEGALGAPAADVEIAREAVPGIAAHASRTLTVTVDPAAAGLTGLAPGVYPLAATYATGSDPAVAAGVIVVPDAAADPSGPIGVIVPITAPALTAGLLTADQLAELTAPGGALRDQLDAVTGAAAILAVDPAILAAIRVLGSSAPAAAQQWLADLLALPNSRFALQFGDADLATQIAAGVGAPLTVPTLAPYMSADDFTALATPTPATPPAATPTPAPEPGTLPTLAALLDIGEARSAVYWPATGTAGSGVVAALRDRGVDEVAAVTLVPSDEVSGAAGAGSATAAWAQSDGAGVLVYDAEISAALHEASAAPGSVTQAAALAAASAYAHLATSGTDRTAPLLVTVDRAATRTGDALRTALTAASSLAGRTAVDLDTLMSGTPAAVTLAADAEPDADRVAALTDFLQGEGDLASFATILADPTVLTAPERATVLQLLGNAWREAPVAFADAVTQHQAATATTLDAVGIVPVSDITLLATAAPLTFTVRNDLAWPVSLVLITTPGDPRLRVQNSTPIEAGAAQNTRVKVPVEARVGSGESTLTLQLRSPTMIAIGPSVPVAVAVRAEWESVGIVVMVTLIAAMLVAGVVRTVLRLRRRAAAERTPEPERTQEPEGTDADG
ncbi:DUF6049 family protein [Microbacterium sp. CH-015]|uniref:DUF6049 family protein n=1 Tax=Microbacterium sp. CH-015 TaxID=3406734 RepID=UPI003C713F09